MALIKCKECGKEISDQANACPNCGAKPYKPSGCLAVFVAVAVLIVIFSLVPGTPKPPAPFDAEATVRGLCMMHIKGSLNDPDSADFEHSSSTVASKNGDVWTVQRPVRAKNAFNATRRAIFECKYRQAAEIMTLLSVKQISP